MTSLALALVYGLGNEMRPVSKATSKTWQERGERGRGCAGLLIEIYKMNCLPPKVELGIG